MIDHTTRQSSREIPYGYCHCGCGQKTSLAKSTDRRQGRIKGKPNDFLKGHHAPLPRPEPSYCKCGCGQKVPEFKTPSRQPQYIRGHQQRINTQEQGFQKYNVSGNPDDCWLWPGTIYKSTGYGVGICLGKPYLAHRASYSFHFGPIPKGMYVCHKCDNPACVNPNHLFLGTPADNSRDMADKGRSLQGRRHPQAKITEAQVYEIRRLAKTGINTGAIAKTMGISRYIVRRVRQGQTWTHVP